MKLSTPHHEAIRPFELNKMSVSEATGNRPAISGPKGSAQATRSPKAPSKNKGHHAGKPRPQKDKKIGGEISEIERDAYERGFAAGEAAGHRIGMKKIEQSSQIISEMLEGMNTLQMELVQAAEEDILAISLAVAQRILGHEVGTSRETILKDIQEAIKKIGQGEKLVVHLAPSDHGIMTQETDTFSHLLKEGGALKFEPDDRLSPGECIIDGNERMIDGRFDSQMAVFVDALKKKESDP